VEESENGLVRREKSESPLLHAYVEERENRLAGVRGGE